METITKYIAYDGREFTSECLCMDYESKCRVADTIVSELGERPDDCDYQNGQGCLQHERDTFLRVRRKLLEQAQIEHPHKWFTQSIENESVHPSWAYRIIDEACTGRLSKAWFRIVCTDGKFREWGQPYLRDHPEEASLMERIN